MIDEAGVTGFHAAALGSRVGVRPGDVPARIASLVADGIAVHVGDVLIARPVFERLQAAIVNAVAEHHRTQPLSDGLPREEARVRLFARGAASVFDRALADLTAALKVVGHDRLALAAYRVHVAPDVARARDTIERLFLQGGLAPPDLASVVSAAGAAPAVADQAVRLLQRDKVLVKLDALLFHDQALKTLKQDVAALKTSAGANARLDVPAFKERFGVTRKFAIPLLEYLDRERVTRRMGDARVIL